MKIGTQYFTLLERHFIIQNQIKTKNHKEEKHVQTFTIALKQMNTINVKKDVHTGGVLNVLTEIH
jgi:selenophosphate synthetase-related protein